MKSAGLSVVIAVAALLGCSDADDQTTKPIDTPVDPSGPPTVDGPVQPSTDPDVGRENGARIDQDMADHYKQTNRGPALSFGVPRTDDVAISLRCPPDSMGEAVILSFRRPAEIVEQRPDTITLNAAAASQELTIDTRKTELGTTVEVRGAPDSPVLQAYRGGAVLSAAYGEETIAIPSRRSDTEVEEFFRACSA